MSSLKIKRGSYAQLVAAAAADQLKEGEPYLIGDQGRIAIGTSTSTFEVFAKLSEVAQNTFATFDKTATPSFNVFEWKQAATVQTSDVISCKLIPNDDFDGDDLTDFELFAWVEQQNFITFQIVRFGPIAGTFKVAYKVN